MWITKEYLIRQLKNFERIILRNKYVKQEIGKSLTSNDLTDELKTKLETLSNYDDTSVKNRLNDIESDYLKAEDITSKVDKVDGYGLSKNNLTDELKEKLDNLNNYDDSSLSGRVEAVENNIGDISTVTAMGATTLSQAIGGLYLSFMKSITYANKKLTITYRNGKTSDIDMSSIIVDTDIQELKNVAYNTTKDEEENDVEVAPAEGQALAFDVALQKWMPRTFDLVKCLSDAKDYTDSKIKELAQAIAISCDEKPTLSENTVTYKINEETKTLTLDNRDIWFWYKDSDDENIIYQTAFIDGIEFTVKTNNSINADDYVKTSDVSSDYTGEEDDLTPVANLSALKDLYDLLATKIGLKVNTADIVNDLTSDSTDKPLSAAQGKALNGKFDSYLPLTGGTMTGGIGFSASQSWPTFNQDTTGSAATLTPSSLADANPDTMYKTGLYQITSLASGCTLPIDTWAELWVMNNYVNNNSARVVQIVWHDTDASVRYIRTCYNGTWTAWTKIPVYSDLIKNAGSNPTLGNPDVNGGITQPAGDAPISIRTSNEASRDAGIFFMNQDAAYIANSADSGYAFGVFDTDKTADMSSADNASFVVLQNQDGTKQKGLLRISSSGIEAIFGSQNDGWVHFTNNSAKPYYFDNKISVNGNIELYNTDYYIGNNGYFNGTSQYCHRNGNEFAQQINLTDTSLYDYNTYYPCTIGLSTDKTTRINVDVSLNTGKYASWQTHDAGFTVHVELETIGSGWGTSDPICYVKKYDYRFCTSMPVSWSQMTQGSVGVLWLRGGGIYNIGINGGSSRNRFEVQRGTYTVHYESVAPTTSLPSISDYTWRIRAENANYATIANRIRTSTPSSLSDGDIWIS